MALVDARSLLMAFFHFPTCRLEREGGLVISTGATLIARRLCGSKMVCKSSRCKTTHLQSENVHVLSGKPQVEAHYELMATSRVEFRRSVAQSICLWSIENLAFDLVSGCSFRMRIRRENYPSLTQHCKCQRGNPPYIYVHVSHTLSIRTPKFHRAAECLAAFIFKS